MTKYKAVLRRNMLLFPITNKYKNIYNLIQVIYHDGAVNLRRAKE